ncbi:trypco2 family protein [Streptomyces sp. NPDC056656]|uniref:trypco2 family protein n=1 Tax=Streptomyces sp. NPDC056656 TaxID=3345895 RepID=UPI0036A6BCBC
MTQGGAMASSGHDEDWLDLADAIEVLRSQLSEAQRRGQGSQLRFVLGEITAEFEIELVRTRNGGGALRFGVVEANGRQERATRSARRVPLRLNPERRGGGDVSVGDIEQSGGGLMEEHQVVLVHGAGLGSGCLIAPRLVLTAAHLLPPPDTPWRAAHVHPRRGAAGLRRLPGSGPRGDLCRSAGRTGRAGRPVGVRAAQA